MAQRDPLNEYKSEAFQLFDELIARLREVTTSQLSRVEVAFEPPPAQSAPPAFIQAAATGASFEGPVSAGPMLAIHPAPPAFGAEEAGSTATLVRPDQSAGEASGLRQGRPQPALPLRLGQEIQALPRRAGLKNAGSAIRCCARHRLKKITNR